MKKFAAVLLLNVSAMSPELSGTWIGTFIVPGIDHEELRRGSLVARGRQFLFVISEGQRVFQKNVNDIV
jgi:hypothetical protein